MSTATLAHGLTPTDPTGAPLALRVSKPSGDSNAGGLLNVLLVNAAGATFLGPRTPVASSALGHALELLGAAGTVFGIIGDLGTAADGTDTMASGTYWILVVDATSEPGAGAVTPLLSRRVVHTLGVPQSFELGDEVGGVSVTTGAMLLLSTTGPGTYTPAGAYMTASASVRSP